jgi:hypothetical protein
MTYDTPEDLLAHPKLVAGFKKIEATAKFAVDMSLMDEIKGYVSIAKAAREKADKLRLPTRYKTEEDLHRLAAFLVQTQANRDRVIEIKLQFLPLQRSLDRMWEKFVGLIYQHDCIRKLAPQPARDATINYVLDPLRERISKVAMIIAAAAEADRNLGNAYFTLKELKTIGIVYIEAKRAQKGV